MNALHETNMIGASATAPCAREARPPTSELCTEAGPTRFEAAPWPEAVDGKALLDELREVLTRHVILPESASETLALWTLHTYAFELRDIYDVPGNRVAGEALRKDHAAGCAQQTGQPPGGSGEISSPAPKTMWKDGAQAKGYLHEDFKEVFQRYIPRSELEAFKRERLHVQGEESDSPAPPQS
jgi:hypothetical protein